MPTTPLYLLPPFLLRGFFSTEALLALVATAPLFVFLLFVLLSPSCSPSPTSPLLSASPSSLLGPVNFNVNLPRLLVVVRLASGLTKAGTIPNHHISNYPVIFNTTAYLPIAQRYLHCLGFHRFPRGVA